MLHALSSALDAGYWSGSRHRRFILGSRTSVVDWIGGWVGTRAGLDAVTRRKNPSPCGGSNKGRPGCSLSTILTELPRIPFFWNYFKNYRRDITIISKVILDTIL
jgi:hypothetical protein